MSVEALSLQHIYFVVYTPEDSVDILEFGLLMTFHYCDRPDASLSTL
jgi:hypothetical protein